MTYERNNILDLVYFIIDIFIELCFYLIVIEKIQIKLLFLNIKTSIVKYKLLKGKIVFFDRESGFPITLENLKYK